MSHPQATAQATQRTTRSTARRHPCADAMLSTSDAAEYLGVGVSTLRKWQGQGRIQPVRVGDKLLRWRIADLDKFVSAA